MVLFKDWLLGVTACALLVALAEQLTPKGTVRKLGKLTGGLLLLVAVLQPVLKVDYGSLSAALSQYRDDLGGYEAQPTVETARLMKTIIEARSGAYIQDKAAGLGLTCRAEVECDWDSEGSYPYPARVTVWGELTEGERARLTALIEADLAIPAQAQRYEREDGGHP